MPTSGSCTIWTRITRRPMISRRKCRSEGWYANTTPPVAPWVLNAPMPDVNAYKWELYNLDEDYSQANDLAAKMQIGRMVREHDPACCAVGAERADAGRQCLQVGAVQSGRGLLAGQRSRGEN